MLNVMMKWLTREWASGALDDDEWNERWRMYSAHEADVLPRLRNGAERLVQSINLHDAQVQSFEYGTDEKLVLRALIGDLQVGYSFIELNYLDAEVHLEP